MMVESRDHRALCPFSLSLSLGRRPRRCCCSSSVFRVASSSSWVISYSVAPVLWPLWLLLPPTLIGRRARTLPRQARSAPGLSRSLLFTIVDQGWGAVYGYIGHFFGSILGTSDWVRGTLRTRTIRG